MQHRIAAAPTSSAACHAAWVIDCGDPLADVAGLALLDSPEVVGPLAVAGLALGARRDPRHRRHDQRRIVADRRLGRQHHGVGAVEHGVGDVADLGARRRRGVDHRLQHLRRRDDRGALLDAVADDPLLQVRDVLERAVDAEVAAGHHHGVGGRGDAGEVAERRGRLDLGDDLRSVADDAAELLDVARPADERQGDVVGAGRGHRLGELEILGGRGVQGEPLARQVDAGPTLRAPTGLDLGDERVGGLVDDPQRDLAVAEHDPFTDVDVREQVGVVDGDLLGGALAVAGDEPNDGRRAARSTPPSGNDPARIFGPGQVGHHRDVAADGAR